MAISEEALRVKLLDAKKGEAELRALRRELEKTTGVSGKSSSAAKAAENDHVGLLKKLGSGLAYGGGLIGLAGVGYGLADITKGGIEAQQRQILLKQALQQTGQAGSKHIGEINKAIEETSGHGGFSALEETEGITNLVRETKSSTAAIKDNAAAIDLARGLHESYGTAVSQVQKVETGAVGRLQKYLGIIQPVKYYVEQLSAAEKKRFPEKLKEAELLDKEATAREANRRILERYGGAVTAYNKSTAGAISNANNAFKQATEQLGEKLLPAETAVATWFGKLITEIEKGEGVWKTVGRDITDVWHALEGVYHFLESHKGLATALGYGAALGIGVKTLSKVPGASLIKKVLKYAPEEGGAEAGAEGVAGAAAPETGGASLVVGGLTIGAILGAEKVAKGLHDFTLGANSGGSGERLTTKEQKLLHEEETLTRKFEQTGVPQDAGQRMELQMRQQEAREEKHAQQMQQAVERGMANHHSEIHMDGEKVGKVLRQNPQAARQISEANTEHIQRRKARE